MAKVAPIVVAFLCTVGVVGRDGRIRPHSRCAAGGTRGDGCHLRPCNAKDPQLYGGRAHMGGGTARGHFQEVDAAGRGARQDVPP
eukprot:6206466-Pleurochrysis_carterae.AAC.1